MEATLETNTVEVALQLIEKCNLGQVTQCFNMDEKLEQLQAVDPSLEVTGE